MTIMAPLWFAVTAAIVLAGLLLSRSRTRFLTTATALELLAAGMLWVLLCDLRFDDDRQQITLMTPGFAAAPGLGSEQLSWRADGSGDIISPREIALRYGENTAIEVRGHGLPASAWREGHAGILNPTPPTLPDGFIAARWPAHLQLGEPLVLQGQLSGSADTVELRLHEQVIARSQPSVDGSYQLQTILPVTGRYALDLVALQGDREVHRELVASEVRDIAPPVVHIDLSRPSFESRALKNWLQSAGVAGRFSVTLAPGIARDEPLAQPADAADLWITDTATLRSLPASQRQRRLAEVEAGQKNLLILADADDVPMLGTWFPTAAVADPDVTVTIDDQGLEATRVLAFLPDSRPLLNRTAGLTAVQNYGRGRIAALALADSYRWLGQGHHESYARFWTRLLTAMLPPRADTLWLEHSEHQATVGLRSTICVSGLETPDLQPAPTIPLLLRLQAADFHCRDWWPEQAGWNQIEEHRVYVYTDEQWSALRAGDRQRATAAAATISSPVARHTQVLLDRRMLWLILFLAAALPLWVSNSRGSPG